MLSIASTISGLPIGFIVTPCMCSTATFVLTVTFITSMSSGTITEVDKPLDGFFTAIGRCIFCSSSCTASTFFWAAACAAALSFESATAGFGLSPAFSTVGLDWLVAVVLFVVVVVVVELVDGGIVGFVVVGVGLVLAVVDAVLVIALVVVVVLALRFMDVVVSLSVEVLSSPGLWLENYGSSISLVRGSSFYI